MIVQFDDHKLFIVQEQVTGPSLVKICFLGKCRRGQKPMRQPYLSPLFFAKCFNLEIVDLESN